MKKRFFVAGTDTGVGKTTVTAGLLRAANEQGLRTLGLKPVAAGCEQVDHQLRNEDANTLIAESSVKLPYQQVNPVALEEAIAPHIAAANSGKKLSLDRIEGFCRGALMTPSDLVLIEGAGGWRVPLNEVENISGLSVKLGFPVILVVGMRLGCLNHAILTAEAIIRDGLSLAGWVAVSLSSDMPYEQENIGTLRFRLPCPYLGHVPFMQSVSIDEVFGHLDLETLMNHHQ